MISNDYSGEIAEFVRFAHRCGDASFYKCSSGNLSMRVGECVLISATGSWLPVISEGEVSVCNISSGKILNGVIPSIEHVFHLMVMKSRPEVNIVLHFQSEYATIVSCMKNIPTNFNVTAEVPLYIGNEIPIIPFLRPGSLELAEAVSKGLADHNLVLLANHGQVVCGESMEDVFRKVTFFEMACGVIVRTNGDYSHLPDGFVL